MSGFRAKLVLAAALVALPGAALAHPGAGHVHDFTHGFAHPLGGLDHLLAMLAVGMFATLLGGRALWLVPASFLALMALGGALAMMGVQVPYTEALIATSVVVLGLAVAARIGIPTLAAMALVGFFALFHGYAHGAEMADVPSPLRYAAGFIAATALLHAVGIGLGLLIGHLGEGRARGLARATGGAIALAGVAILSGLI
jgi:urease accessory protein